MSPTPARALTRTSKLLRGRWKFVISASSPWKTCPGRMNRPVDPVKGSRRPDAAAVSRVRAEVVPTATIRPPRRATGVQGGGRVRRQVGPLGVHDVVVDGLGFDGAERADPDMEGQVHPGDPPRGQVREDVLAEVEPRGRRRDRARMMGVDGLIPRPVSRRLLALANIGGQGGLPVTLQESQG